MQLLIGAADGVREEQDITLHPGNLLARILETDTGTAHVDYGMEMSKIFLRESGQNGRSIGKQGLRSFLVESRFGRAWGDFLAVLTGAG